MAYVELYFPIRLVLTDDNLVGYSGDLGGCRFYNGMSELVSYRSARNFSLNYKVVEAETGVRFHPCTERSQWRVAVGSAADGSKGTNEWNYVTEPCKQVLDREAAMADLIKSNMDLAEGKLAARLAQRIDIGNELDMLAGRATAPAGGVIVPAGEAGEGAAVADGAPQEPVDASLATAEQLDAVRKTFGARFLRQQLEAMGLKTARSGDDMIEELLEAKVSAATVRGWLAGNGSPDKVPETQPIVPTEVAQAEAAKANLGKLLAEPERVEQPTQAVEPEPKVAEGEPAPAPEA
mgnify:FL=1